MTTKKEIAKRLNDLEERFIALEDAVSQLLEYYADSHDEFADHTHHTTTYRCRCCGCCLLPEIYGAK